MSTDLRIDRLSYMVLSSAYVGQPNRCCMMRSTRDTPKGWRRSEHLQAAPWHDHLHHLCEQLFRVAPRASSAQIHCW
jgi:hypothetical protein